VAAGSVPAPSAEDDFERCFKASYRRLVGELTVVTTSQAEAEEVVQEAFGRLWRAWAQVCAYDNVEAWVRRVAINVAIDRWRRDTRLGRLDEAARTTVDDPADSALAVLSELRRLSTDQRVALLLHHVVGLSVDEVATEMSTRPGTVKSWLSRGRAALERLLEERGCEQL
jgi:RNA polymerase sigma-70 factor, ECF subfamily